MLRGMFSTPFLRIFLYFECLLVENVTINLEEQKKTFSLRLIYYPKFIDVFITALI